MLDLSIESESPRYGLGDVARFTVTADFGPDGYAPDIWMSPTIWQLDEGKPVAPDRYPDYPMHESDSETEQVGWFVHPVLRGRWGTFRAEATVYEPEREELGKVYVDFEVIGSAGEST
jgi:hypothetical protein